MIMMMILKGVQEPSNKKIPLTKSLSIMRVVRTTLKLMEICRLVGDHDKITKMTNESTTIGMVGLGLDGWISLGGVRYIYIRC